MLKKKQKQLSSNEIYKFFIFFIFFNNDFEIKILIEIEILNCKTENLKNRVLKIFKILKTFLSSALISLFTGNFFQTKFSLIP